MRWAKKKKNAFGDSRRTGRSGKGRTEGYWQKATRPSHGKPGQNGVTKLQSGGAKQVPSKKSKKKTKI